MLTLVTVLQVASPDVVAWVELPNAAAAKPLFEKKTWDTWARRQWGDAYKELLSSRVSLGGLWLRDGALLHRAAAWMRLPKRGATFLDQQLVNARRSGIKTQQVGEHWELSWRGMRWAAGVRDDFVGVAVESEDLAPATWVKRVKAHAHYTASHAPASDALLFGFVDVSTLYGALARGRNAREVAWHLEQVGVMGLKGVAFSGRTTRDGALRLDARAELPGTPQGFLRALSGSHRVTSKNLPQGVTARTDLSVRPDAFYSEVLKLWARKSAMQYGLFVTQQRAIEGQGGSSWQKVLGSSPQVLTLWRLRNGHVVARMRVADADGLNELVKTHLAFLPVPIAHLKKMKMGDLSVEFSRGRLALGRHDNDIWIARSLTDLKLVAHQKNDVAQGGDALISMHVDESAMQGFGARLPQRVQLRANIARQRNAYVMNAVLR